MYKKKRFNNKIKKIFKKILLSKLFINKCNKLKNNNNKLILKEMILLKLKIK